MAVIHLTSLIIEGELLSSPFLLGEDMDYREKVCTNFIVKDKPRLPYGNKDRGKFVPQEKGRRAIFVPSFGTMEKEEVEYIVQAVQEKEDERLKKKEMTPQKQNLENLITAMKSAKEGERYKTGQQILKEVK